MAASTMEVVARPEDADGCPISPITRERAGLSTYGNRRSVSGLRREEVALLAGISVE